MPQMIRLMHKRALHIYIRPFFGGAFSYDRIPKTQVTMQPQAKCPDSSPFESLSPNRKHKSHGIRIPESLPRVAYSRVTSDSL